ncbi:MAG: sel1 repeat family protein [Nitrosomonadales bacterium]|nr:sel1 repeat family protein [Nitrosomonadales bacterium]
MARSSVHEVTPLIAILVLVALLSGCEPNDQKGAAVSELSNSDITSLLSTAENGNKDAQFSLAVKYHLGNGVAADPAKAAFWYEKAANSGHLGAMNNLAALYYDGKGVKQDFNKAIELYKKISEAGDISGTASLAGMYMDGKGVSQDYNEARRLYTIAAQRGYGPAQNAIGMMYKFGWGVPQNNIEAYAWWILATGNGDAVASDNMKELRVKLGVGDIARAEERAKQLAASISPNDFKLTR